MNTFKQILKPLASLWITVALLAASIVLVFAGTLAQRTEGIWQVQKEYFYTWIAWIPVQNLLPFVEKQVPGEFPFAGGFLMAALLLINLLSAHTVRFKLNWKRSGIILIHLGIILLLVGQLIAARQVESQIQLQENESTRWSQEGTGVHELAVVDPSPSDHDDVVVISDSQLQKKIGQPIHDKRLPFDVTVVKYFTNSATLGPFQAGGENLATAGTERTLKIAAMPRVAANQDQEVDRPSAFVKLSRDGKDLGTYLVSQAIIQAPGGDPRIVRPETVDVGGKRYQIALRPMRIYRPYSITLLKFSYDRYQGTDVARNYSSLIRLVDPEEHVDREVLIRMNEPLRYRGETFYQQRMGTFASTIQVVRNPGWVMPYVACSVGGLGMVIHFGMTLINFLRRRAKSLAQAATGGVLTAGETASKSNGHRAGKSKRGGRLAVPTEASYTLQPTRGLSGLSALVAGITLALSLALIGIWATVALSPVVKGPTGTDLDVFSKVPVLVEGRVMPLDSVARASLKIISQRESFTDADKKPRPAIQWLADVMSGNKRANDYKVFRIDHPQIKGLLGLTPENGPKIQTGEHKGEPKYAAGDKLFSFNEMFPDEAAFRKLSEQSRQAFAVDHKLRDPYQRKVIELDQHINVFMRLRRTSDLSFLYGAMISLESQLHEMAASIQNPRMTPEEFKNSLTPEQQQLVGRYQLALREIDRATEAFAAEEGKNHDFFYGIPEKDGGDWAPLAVSLREYAHTHQIPQTASDWFVLLDDLHSDNTADFNTHLAAYMKGIESSGTRADVNLGAANFEVFYNRLDPFSLASWGLYLMAFVLCAVLWLTGKRPVWAAAFVVVILAFIVHTFGIGCRMYITGRPPVTNLYSSALFIGWGAVVLCVGLELIYRKGIGFAVAAGIAFVTLMIAGGLAVDDAFSRGEGDTMAPLQAVLDTNMWLATHVVCVTLGYAATFLAGLLGIVYVAGGLTTRLLDSTARKEVNRMLYAIVCFAMLFSFVGTILGGIWADQSWGRFWGWDSKENGAVLVVIWNAIILHARWGGLVRERGMAVLAIFGNIVTAWSWFGTNMLGVGLHSYGRMDAAALPLASFVLSQIALIAIGLLPLSLWKSYAESDIPLPRKPVKAIPV